MFSYPDRPVPVRAAGTGRPRPPRSSEPGQATAWPAASARAVGKSHRTSSAGRARAGGGRRSDLRGCRGRARAGHVARDPARDPTSHAREHDRRGGRRRPAEPRRGRAARIRDLCGKRLQRGHHDQAVRERGGGIRERIVLAAGCRAARSQPWERQQGRQLARPTALERGLVEARDECMPPARLAVGQVAGDLPTLTNPKRAQGATVAPINHRLHVLAAATTDELLVLLAQPAASAEQRALDHRPRHSHPLRDLADR